MSNGSSMSDVEGGSGIGGVSSRSKYLSDWYAFGPPVSFGVIFSLSCLSLYKKNQLDQENHQA